MIFERNAENFACCLPTGDSQPAHIKWLKPSPQRNMNACILARCAYIHTYRRGSAGLKARRYHIFHHFLHDGLIGFILCLNHNGLSLLRRQLRQLCSQVGHCCVVLCLSVFGCYLVCWVAWVCCFFCAAAECNTVLSSCVGRGVVSTGGWQTLVSFLSANLPLTYVNTYTACTVPFDS